MDQALEDRVRNEREHYNFKEVKKRWTDRTYVKLLKHAYDNPSNKRSLKIQRDILRAADGGHILEIGCRSWPMLIQLGKCRPGKLTCINISESELEIGRDLARKANLDCEMDFRLMDAHDLRFPEGEFDVVYGSGILHHLDHKVALPECARVLKPGGTCFFCEPLRYNPLGVALRAITPDARTRDERPLGREEIENFSRVFEADIHYFQLVSLVLGVVSPLLYDDPVNPLMELAERIDLGAVEKAPFLGPYYRFAVLEGKKPLPT